VPENRHHDVLDHVNKIFLRDEPLAHCFLPCTTGQRQQKFCEYATMQLRSGCCVMALDGSTVVGACLNRPLTRDEVMLNSVPPSVGPGMNWHSICFQYQYVFQHVLLGVSDKEWGEQFVATRDTKVLWPSQENDFDLESGLPVGSLMVSYVLNSNWCSLSEFRYIWLNVVSCVCEFISYCILFGWSCV